MVSTSLIGVGLGPAAAGFPGGNGKIAYEKGSDIWIMRADGSEQLKLISGSDPAWSPDGTRLAFSLGGEIYVWEASGVLVNKTGSGATETNPAWSPDGKNIVYERGGDVWLMDADNAVLPNQRVWISEITHTHRQPAWSPDGSQILTVREPVGGGDQEIHAADAAAPWIRINLTNNSGVDEHHPEWAPGNTRIAYIRSGQLWIMAKNGTGQSQVTSVFPDSLTAPSWAPDVSKIAAQWFSGITTNWEIYTVTDQTWAMSDITNTAPPHTEADPNWAVQYPPLTKPDAVTVAEGASATGNVLTNDKDVFALTRTVGQVGAPANGTVTIAPSGSFTYQHNGSDTIADSFAYRVMDGSINSALTTVTVTVTPVNDAPVAVNDAYSVAGGGVLTVNGVLDNDTDTDGGALSALKVTDPAHGTLTLAANGSFTYVHDGSAANADSFTYKANDGAADSNIATVTIAVTPIGHDVGLVDPATGQWNLRKATTGAVTTLFYGTPGDIPFMGDWDCDGDETLGLYRQSDGFVYIRNSNTQGPGEIKFFFGNPSDVPLAGDFNGDGCDTVSIYRPGETKVYITNSLGPNNGVLPQASIVYFFGTFGDKPFVGDFNGNGSETIGLHRESNGFVYFRNTHDTGVANNDYFFGNPGDHLIAGDWGIVDGVYTPAAYRPSDATFYFRHTNTLGVADSEFFMGDGTWRPVAGQMGL